MRRVALKSEMQQGIALFERRIPRLPVGSQLVVLRQGQVQVGLPSLAAKQAPLAAK